MTRARYDKHGRRLPDTGRGCGCGLCEVENAPRYERRQAPGERAATWGVMRRTVAKLVLRAG